MKRYSLVLMTLLFLLIATGAHAVAQFPFCPADMTATFTLQQGWFDTRPVWFFCTDTNDINFASTNQFPFKQMTLAPPLASLAGRGTNFVFFNVCFQQGPIFSAIPNTSGYSGLWQVKFILFKPGVTPVPICSVGQIMTLLGQNKITVVDKYGTTRSVAIIDCPIMVGGQLNNPLPTVPNANTFFVSPQVLALNPATKQVTIPAYTVFCQERVSKFIDRCRLIIPDVANPQLANILRANVAPLLAGTDPANRQNFYCITGGPTGCLKAPNQLPVICQCPDGVGARQTNPLYTPVMNFVALNPGPNFPFSPADRMICFANNCSFIETILIPRGIFTPQFLSVINAPVLDCTRIQLPTGGCPNC